MDLSNIDIPNPAKETANAVSLLAAWLKKPFDPNMSAVGWTLFFGLLVVISILWAFVLKETD